jgi:hypothetical protein
MLEDNELRRIAREQQREANRGQVIAGSVVDINSGIPGLVTVQTVSGSILRARSICNRALTVGEPIQVTLGAGQQTPIVDGLNR